MRALIFDLDGVIVATDRLHRRSWKRLAAEEDLAFDDVIAARLLGRTRADSLDILLDRRRVADADREALLARKQRYFLEEAKYLSPRDVAPGLVGLLDEADRARVPCAVASSSSNAWLILAKLELTSRFELIADGGSVRAPKPAPDIFLWVARQLGALPEDSIVFEDSRAGVEAAAAGGFQVAAIGLETPLARWSPTSLDQFALELIKGVPALA